MTRTVCLRCGTELSEPTTAGLCPGCLLEVAQVDDAASPGLPDEAELARMFPDLSFLEAIGSGATGRVWLVRQTRPGRTAALKLIDPELLQTPEMLDRFQREARSLATLDHPHVVRLYDFGVTSGLCWLLMEHVAGGDLRQLLRLGPLSQAQICRILGQACAALESAHQQGIVHRDIKPENLLIDRQGNVRLCDFGVAHIAGAAGTAARLTGAHQRLGTPHYMAPEQVEAPATVDHRADVFALGVLLYEMATGELPLGRFPMPSTFGASPQLDAIVLTALEKEPGRRFQTVAELRQRIEALAGGDGGEHAAALLTTASGKGLVTLAILAAVVIVSAFMPWLRISFDDLTRFMGNDTVHFPGVTIAVPAFRADLSLLGLSPALPCWLVMAADLVALALLAVALRARVPPHPAALALALLAMLQALVMATYVLASGGLPEIGLVLGASCAVVVVAQYIDLSSKLGAEAKAAAAARVGRVYPVRGRTNRSSPNPSNSVAATKPAEQ